MEWIKAFAIGIIIFAFIRTFFFSNYVVEGGINDADSSRGK